MNAKITKTTSKGQITLPKKWRDQFKTDTYRVEMKDSNLLITPIFVAKTANETVIFDADRDNNGKGVSVDKMIKLLKDL
ncbi:AbrB/MazE/SpoVT family DNA-binding domain-containing protein [Patescibacteria group bacterium]|nr:AbrB/MazE/SpoVT family DNA-binding domain-containing protein [Patescibacteria group bacterium]